MLVRDMAKQTDTERARWPYVVVVDDDAIRFDSKPGADLYAGLMGNSARRFVAVDGPEYREGQEIPGYREVTYFA